MCCLSKSVLEMEWQRLAAATKGSEGASVSATGATYIWEIWLVIKSFTWLLKEEQLTGM